MITLQSGTNSININLADKIIYNWRNITFDFQSGLTTESTIVKPILATYSEHNYQFLLYVMATQSLSEGIISLNSGYYDVFIYDNATSSTTLSTTYSRTILSDRCLVSTTQDIVSNIQDIEVTGQFFGPYIVGPQGVQGPTGPQGLPGDGVEGNNDLGVIYLKENKTPTPIPSINARAVVAGTMSTGILYNFEKDATTNSLKYTGTGGRFHVVANFNFFEGSQKVCGFYIGKNTNGTGPLDPNADRISESEIYINSGSNSAQPVSGMVQTILDLNNGDRIFFIVQNRDASSDITVEFLKFIAVTTTSERGATGPQGPQGVQGLTGPQGFQGVTGPQGVQGPIGPQGVQGITGPQGVQGFQGVTGPQGVDRIPASGDGPLQIRGTTVSVVPRSGTWVNRPTDLFSGQVYFATDLGNGGSLLTWNGTRWTGRITYSSGSNTLSGNTTALTVVASVNIPSGLMSTNSRIEVSSFYIATATASQTWGFRSYMTSVSATDTTTGEFSRLLSLASTQRQGGSVKTISNQNSLSSQRFFLQVGANVTYVGSNAVDPTTTTLSINTANQFWINFAIIKSLGTDSVALNHYLIDIIL